VSSINVELHIYRLMLSSQVDEIVRELPEIQIGTETALAG
jgi:hypothetical protein